jgi:hypothetical protein
MFQFGSMIEGSGFDYILSFGLKISYHQSLNYSSNKIVFGLSRLQTQIVTTINFRVIRKWIFACVPNSQNKYMFRILQKVLHHDCSYECFPNFSSRLSVSCFCIIVDGICNFVSSSGRVKQNI